MLSVVYFLSYNVTDIHTFKEQKVETKHQGL